MFVMTIENTCDMDAGRKISTMRPIKPSGKGYFKTGSTQLIKLNRFSRTWFLKIKITGREIVNLDDLTREDFLQCGYMNRAQYLAEPFNQTNPDPDRVRYWFEVTERGQHMDELNEAFYNMAAAKAARNIYYNSKCHPRPTSSPYDREIKKAEEKLQQLKRL